MQVRVTGNNIELGQSLTDFVKENLESSVIKYFENAIDAEVHFSKNGHLFKTVITVNEGVKGGITVKSSAEAGDVYACFNEACAKAVKQLRKYKERIVNYHKKTKSLKEIEPNYKIFDANKYILPPLEINEVDNNNNFLNNSTKVVSQKTTNIETLKVDEAIMKMDLLDLPALVFINADNNRINIVYHRKDGNISWIDPEIK